MVLKASFTTSIKARLLCAASFPPFSNKPLPEAMASAATCGSESGLDSKITSRTPIGTVICFNCRPSASFVLRNTLPTFSWLESAICLRPVARLFNLAGVNDRRDSSGLANPDFVASVRSFWFASRISACLDIKRSASVCTQEALCSADRV